jgi:surface polysaccharide O-acyltransferase-like enzyme
LTRAAGKFDNFFYDFVTLNVILATGAAFLLLRWLSETKLFMSANAQAATRILAVSAFGIYLVHPLVIEVLSDWIPFVHINSFMGNAIWSVPLTTTAVFFLSFLIVYLLQKIPILKQIVP